MNSHPSKIDNLTGQGGAPPAEMSRNIPAACSLAQECGQVPWRNGESTVHVQNVLTRLEQTQQRFQIGRDNVLSKFFTNDPLQDINTLDVSTDWCWLSILESKKRRVVLAWLIRLEEEDVFI